MIAIYCCLSPFWGFGQSYITHLQEYGVSDGLVHRSVQCITQDQKGFIWIGTEQGLSRFDGYSFKNWTKSEHGLSSDRIEALFVAPDGLIWVFYSKGSIEKENFEAVDILDPKTGSVKPLSDHFGSALPAMLKNLGFGIAYDLNGRLYIETKATGGVNSYHPDSGFEYVELGLEGEFAPHFCDENRTIWGTLYPSGKQNGDSKAIGINLVTKQRINLPAKAIPLSFGNFHHASKTEVGYSVLEPGPRFNFWAIDSQNVHKIIDYEDFFFPPFVMDVDVEHSVMVRGLKLMDTNSNEVIMDFKASIKILEKGWRYPLLWYSDRQGRLWLCSQFGLAKIEIEPNRFKRLLYDSDAKANGISCRGMIIAPDGQLLVNTEGRGQHRINLKTGISEMTKVIDVGAFVYGFGKDAEGNIYYTASNTALGKINPQGQTEFLSWPFEGWAWCFFFLDKHRFWAGAIASRGMMEGKLSSLKVQEPMPLNGFGELGSNPAFHIGKGADGSIWICAESGLYQADARKGVLHRFWSGGKGYYHLPSDYFIHFHEDAKGIFWLSTRGNGLIAWDRKKGTYIQYGRKDGMPSLTVYAAYEDGYQHLWLPSDYGIIQFDKKKENVRHIYTTLEGVTHQEFNRISHLQAPDGRLFFGGMNGITHFHPNDFYTASKPHRAPLEIVDCRKYNDDKEEMVDILNEYQIQGQIELSSQDRYCIIKLALLSFSETAHIQYAYRMDDEAVWNFQTDQHIRISGLSYGKHTLHLKARAANGEWSANEISVHIIKRTPIYMRWWFILLLAVFVAFGLVCFFRFRTSQYIRKQREVEEKIVIATQQIAQQAAELRELDTLKSRFFANVSHELRTPLTLMLGPLANNLEHKHQNATVEQNTRAAYYSAKELLLLVNELLDLSKLEAGKMEIRERSVGLKQFVHDIVNEFENHAQRQKISLVFDYQGPEGLRMSIDTSKINKVLKNLLSNAFKFTPKGGNESGMSRYSSAVPRRLNTTDDFCPILEAFVNTLCCILYALRYSFFSI